ncbi:MAG: hypothetical protein FWB85_08200 [Chitinispirillia bacterium]|nr:hypothetical protein [Chitinispirillia bacterium]
MKSVRTIKAFLAAAVCTGLITSCTPVSVRTPTPAESPSAAPQQKTGPAETAPKDTPLSQVAISVPGRPEYPDVETGFASEVTRPEFDQLDFPPPYKPPIPEVEPPRPDEPVTGGKARIYLQRGFLDDVIADLLRVNPFSGENGSRRIFNVTDSTHRRMEFTLTGETRRANGRKATALDFIEIWSRFIASRPAQGLALFRNVQGVDGFITGKNPLVNGFSAADENTIRLRFAKADPLAFHRMNTPTLVSGPFLLGSYYSGGSKTGETKLFPNANSLSGAALLAECIVQTGGDNDAMTSFIDGKYSAMTLYKSTDLEVARTELHGKAELHKLPSDRYFIACKSDDGRVCEYIRGKVNGAGMLRNLIGAEGEAINGVAENADTPEMPGSGVAAPSLPKPFRIIYRDDDPISKAVAEKALADLTGDGMNAEAIGSNAENYEKALVRGQYGAAVGWVPQTVLESQTEQLHLATMWFSDDMDSKARRSDFREIPLFSVNNYLLLHQDMKLYQNRLSGMWVNTAGH